jgi:hypothetical protein
VVFVALSNASSTFQIAAYFDQLMQAALTSIAASRINQTLFDLFGTAVRINSGPRGNLFSASRWKPEQHHEFDDYQQRHSGRLAGASSGPAGTACHQAQASSGRNRTVHPRGAGPADRALPHARARSRIRQLSRRDASPAVWRTRRRIRGGGDRGDREGPDVDEHPPRDGLGAGVPGAAGTHLRRTRSADGRLQDLQAQSRRADLVAELQGAVSRRHPGPVAVADRRRQARVRLSALRRLHAALRDREDPAARDQRGHAVSQLV